MPRNNRHSTYYVVVISTAATAAAAAAETKDARKNARARITAFSFAKKEESAQLSKPQSLMRQS